MNEISKISIDKEVWQLGVDLIKAKCKKQLEKNNHHFQYLHIQQTHIQEQINTLIEMRASGDLTKEEFIE